MGQRGEEKSAVIDWVLAQVEPSPLLPHKAPSVDGLKLAFLPGTGERQSGALSRAFAKAGFHVYLASRTPAKAEHRAKMLRDELQNSQIVGTTYSAAAAAADVVFWMVPITTKAQMEENKALLSSLQTELQDKVIIDVTNVFWVLGESEWGQVSSTLINKAALGTTARWTCAFKHTYYTLLQDDCVPPSSNPHHVIVCGDDGDATAVTMALVDCIAGFKSLYGGALKYTKMVEMLSPLWLAQLERDNYGLEFRAGWRFGP